MELLFNKRDQKHPFERAVSLGTSCYSAWPLQSLGLRPTAYPFDWLFSTPAMVTHMLEDRFTTFLDPAYFEPAVRTAPEASRDSRVCHHSYYRENFGVDWVFNHHDLSRPEVAASYRRRVDHFVAALEDGRKILLLMVNIEGETTQASFERLCLAIDRYGTGNTLLQIDVARTGDVLDFGMGHAMACGRHRRRLFRSTSSIDGVRFRNPIDDLVMTACIEQYPYLTALRSDADAPPA